MSDLVKHRTKLNRRESLQLGAAATATGLIGSGNGAAPAQAAQAAEAAAGAVDPARAPGGFPTRPFVDEMPHLNRYPYLAREVARDSLYPAPGKYQVKHPGPDRSKDEARREQHPRWELLPPVRYYELFEREVDVKLHSDLPASRMWVYQQGGDNPDMATAPCGPTFQSYVNQPILVRIHNQLPAASVHRGYGMPETTTHLHDNHNMPESDGNADDYYPRQNELNPADNDPGRFKDYHWINKPAGFDPADPTNKAKGDPSEAMATLWYHDHRHDFTAANTYRGLVGFYLQFNSQDNNDENAPATPGEPLPPFKFPSGEFDVPLVFADKKIDSSGYLVFDQLEMDGILGNRFTVNGKIQPFFKVKKRQYRFRMLNPGPSRVYGLSWVISAYDDLRDATEFKDFFMIGQDGSVLPEALPVANPMSFMPAQRPVVVADFSKVPVGKNVYIVNVFDQINGNKPEGFRDNSAAGPIFRPVSVGIPMLKLVVQHELGLPPDPSGKMFAGRKHRPYPKLPAGVTELTEAAILAAVNRRFPFPSAPSITSVHEWRFERTNGQWVINKKIYDGQPADRCKQDTAEIWILRNESGGWVHPVHIHFDKFRVLYRANGKKTTPVSMGPRRLDTLDLGPGERAVILIQFRDIVSVDSPDPLQRVTAKYLLHCHNTVHEDHAMMARWDIVA